MTKFHVTLKVLTLLRAFTLVYKWYEQSNIIYSSGDDFSNKLIREGTWVLLGRSNDVSLTKHTEEEFKVGIKFTSFGCLSLNIC